MWHSASSYGNSVVISHGTGNTTLYAHMSSIKVSVGTYVQQGQPIGIPALPASLRAGTCILRW
ncbi:MAG: M23 family metallopeptidase [Oscillospiraceae bacterium]